MGDVCGIVNGDTNSHKETDRGDGVKTESYERYPAEEADVDKNYGDEDKEGTHWVHEEKEAD
jgi:hypothetical protein